MSILGASRADAHAGQRSLDDVDVCFLAWREAPRMLARHHAAVAAALGADWQGSAVLIENASPAGTSAAAREQVERRYPAARRVLLRSSRNLGYGRAMNLAMAECAGRYVALLNSDGRPEPGMLRTLAEALDADPQAIWAAPAVHGPGERGEPPGPPFSEDALAGTALLIRREAFLELGGFDPLYWFYNEDYDASRRARAAGHRLLRVPDAVFHHGKGGRSRRGQLIREWWYAVTDQTLVHHHDASRARAVRRVAAGRTRSLREHGRAGSWPALVALSAATVAWPVSAALAERRRRAPWDAERLRAWLARRRPQLERHVVGPTGRQTPVAPSP